ncbi:MAG TPA: hypothetical protein VF017_10950 [Thermoanaerobaculia bacterium]|nr:hypothetical protein [Thermoanaerobaculia bacterium]
MIYESLRREEIPEEVLAAHRALGPLNEEFLDFVAGTPAALERSSFQPVHDLAFYPLTSWPVFAGGEMLDELTRASVELTRLIKKVPALTFKNDPTAIASYYKLASPQLATMVLEEPNGFDAALARADLVISPQGIKCLEVNLGCPGGLQVPAAEPAYLRCAVLAKFLADQDRPVRVTSALEVELTHVLSSVATEIAWPHSELNTSFIATSELAPEVKAETLRYTEPIYRSLLARHAPGKTGDLLIGSYRDLEDFPEHVALRGRRLAAIIELEQSQWHSTFRHFKSGRMKIFNGPCALILADKRNLALLSELERSPLLSAEERAAISRWIPWSRPIKAGYSHRDGERLYLPEYISANRESLVMKPARSGKGANVHLGRSTSPDLWTQVLREALAARDWIVQDYHQSLPYLCQMGDRGCAVHDLVWGIFVFGSRYGGGFLRVMPRDLHVPINSARGALEAILFEVGAPRTDI